MRGELGNWLLGAGVVLLALGALVKVGLLGWLGNLPGDIDIKREGYRVFVPITSMLVVSLLLSLLAAIIRRFF